MAVLDKARDFYLRGFNSEYIRRRTGISMQSLLKQLLARGETYSKADIINYQIAYIQSKYTADDIESAYEQIIRTFDNPEKARRGRHVECLGCGFGDYPKVFRSILGDERYDALRNRFWHEKQVASVQKMYGVDNVFRKETFDTFVSPDRVAEGREKRNATMMDRYGVLEPNQHPEFKERAISGMKKTMKDKYGVEFATQVPEIAALAAEHRQDTMEIKYGGRNSVEVESLRNKIFENRARNGTLNTSRPEDVLYQLLVERFGEADVFRNALVDKRYPWHVDFYVKSMDLFIELNGDRAHYTRWFDPDSERDRQIVAAWTENMLRIEQKSGKKSRYRKYIRTWTVLDPEKMNRAAEQKLHYLVFWDGSNKAGVPNLSDAKAWFDAGCPYPEDWGRLENTYKIVKVSG